MALANYLGSQRGETHLLEGSWKALVGHLGELTPTVGCAVVMGLIGRNEWGVLIRTASLVMH